MKWMALVWGIAMGSNGPWHATEDSEMRIVDDRVMGGVSRSRVEEAEEGFVFTGTLSRDQGGGFVSMRVIDEDLDVAGAEGIELRVRGDGRVYQLTAHRADVPLRAGSYRAHFEAGESWTIVRLPFATFGAMQMGRDVFGAPSLDGDLAQIEQLGILLTDGPEGTFRLEIASMRPYGEARPRSGDLPAVYAHLVQTIEAGVPLYNQGDAEGCRQLYAQTLTAVSARTELTDGEQVLVRRALEEARDLGPEPAAWRLRYTIDALLAGMPRP